MRRGRRGEMVIGALLIGALFAFVAWAMTKLGVGV